MQADRHSFLATVEEKLVLPMVLSFVWLALFRRRLRAAVQPWPGRAPLPAE